MLKWLKSWLAGRAGSEDDLIAAALPRDWFDELPRKVPFYACLDDVGQSELRARIRSFTAHKTFTPVGNIAITPEMRLVIAAHACLLVLHRPEFGVYERSREILVRPTVFGEPTDAIAPDGSRHLILPNNIGQAWYRGPVILAWKSIVPLMQRRRTRRNVIIHEFAHKLDFLDGVSDGTPPLQSERSTAEWARVFSQEHEALVRAARAGEPTLLDPYGATSPAEFFAVASEAFFMCGAELRDGHRELYAQLAGFYRQDPAQWRWPQR